MRHNIDAPGTRLFTILGSDRRSRPVAVEETKNNLTLFMERPVHFGELAFYLNIAL